jgi:TatD DNase family protein
MIETDCPFMTPEPFRGQRNEPAFVKYVAKRIGEIRNVPTERIAELSTITARRFFGI